MLDLVDPLLERVPVVVVATATASCATIGPWSSSSSTRCTVTPVTLTPHASASATGRRPGERRAAATGCTFSDLPVERPHHLGPEDAGDTRPARGTRCPPSRAPRGSRRRTPRRSGNPRRCDDRGRDAVRLGARERDRGVPVAHDERDPWTDHGVVEQRLQVRPVSRGEDGHRGVDHGATLGSARRLTSNPRDRATQRGRYASSRARGRTLGSRRGPLQPSIPSQAAVATLRRLRPRDVPDLRRPGPRRRGRAGVPGGRARAGRAPGGALHPAATGERARSGPGRLRRRAARDGAPVEPVRHRIRAVRRLERLPAVVDARGAAAALAAARSPSRGRAPAASARGGDRAAEILAALVVGASVLAVARPPAFTSPWLGPWIAAVAGSGGAGRSRLARRGAVGRNPVACLTPSMGTVFDRSRPRPHAGEAGKEPYVANEVAST